MKSKSFLFNVNTSIWWVKAVAAIRASGIHLLFRLWFDSIRPLKMREASSSIWYKRYLAKKAFNIFSSSFDEPAKASACVIIEKAIFSSPICSRYFLIVSLPFKNAKRILESHRTILLFFPVAVPGYDQGLPSGLSKDQKLPIGCYLLR